MAEITQSTGIVSARVDTLRKLARGNLESALDSLALEDLAWASTYSQRATKILAKLYDTERVLDKILKDAEAD